MVTPPKAYEVFHSRMNTTASTSRRVARRVAPSKSSLFTFRVVQQPEYGTNHAYYIDFIQICLGVKFINNDEIRELYEEKGLTTNQIASRFKVSRTVIQCRLRELRINEGTFRG